MSAKPSNAPNEASNGLEEKDLDAVAQDPQPEAPKKPSAFKQMLIDSIKEKSSEQDTNKDGVVDKKEYKAAGGTGEEFDQYDANKDGVLDKDELKTRAAAKVEVAMDVDRTVDTDKDGN